MCPDLSSPSHLLVSFSTIKPQAPSHLLAGLSLDSSLLWFPSYYFWPLNERLEILLKLRSNQTMPVSTLKSSRGFLLSLEGSENRCMGTRPRTAVFLPPAALTRLLLCLPHSSRSRNSGCRLSSRTSAAPALPGTFSPPPLLGRSHHLRVFSPQRPFLTGNATSSTPC